MFYKFVKKNKNEKRIKIIRNIWLWFWFLIFNRHDLLRKSTEEWSEIESIVWVCCDSKAKLIRCYNLNEFYEFTTSWHVIASLFTFIIGKNLRHQTVNFVKVALIPSRMWWRCLRETIQSKTVNFIKITFYSYHSVIVKHTFHILLVIRFVRYFTEIVLFLKRLNQLKGKQTKGLMFCFC